MLVHNRTITAVHRNKKHLSVRCNWTSRAQHGDSKTGCTCWNSQLYFIYCVLISKSLFIYQPRPCQKPSLFEGCMLTVWFFLHWFAVCHILWPSDFINFFTRITVWMPIDDDTWLFLSSCSPEMHSSLVLSLRKACFFKDLNLKSNGVRFSAILAVWDIDFRSGEYCPLRGVHRNLWPFRARQRITRRMCGLRDFRVAQVYFLCEIGREKAWISQFRSLESPLHHYNKLK